MAQPAPRTGTGIRSLVRQPRALAVAAAAALVVAFNVAMVWVHVSQPKGNPNKYRRVAPDIDERIEKTQVNVLRAESVEQSAEKLSEVEMFFWPGVTREVIPLPVLPLPASVGGWDVEAVMSNRRFLKVFDELSRLPKQQAADLVNQEIGRALPVYTELFDADLASKKDSLRPDVDPAVVGTYQTSNNADGEPTVLGMRYKLLALVLVAGDQGLDACRPSILKVARRGKAGYEALCRKDRYNVPAAHAAVVRGSLYNRQILATGLLGTSRRLGGLDAGAKAFRVPRKDRELTHYDAHATMYDLHGRMGMVPVDYSKGRLTVRYLGDLDDETFNAILDAVEGEE